MASFSYTARDKSGVVSKGSLTASDRAAAVAGLVDKGLAPILVKEQAGGLAGKSIAMSGLFKPSKHVKLAEKVVFSRQFATMINAGVPIVQSLGILSEQTSSPAMKRVIIAMSKKVQGGSTLAGAMGEHPEVFSPVYINMVRAGETAKY
jgi:type IV pilus assembly protein PilC